MCRKTRLLVGLLASAAPCAVSAQSITGGIAINAIGGGPLACADVALEDSTGAVVAETRTGTTGAFEFVTPGAGAHALRFSVDGWEPMRTEAITLSLETDNLREYRLVFATEQRTTRARREKASKSPPWPKSSLTRGPLYPTQKRRLGIEGHVLMQFVIDSTGRAVMSTARPLRATDQAFIQAVLDYLPKALYVPARRDARPVCALVQQPFIFQIDQGDGVPPMPR